MRKILSVILVLVLVPGAAWATTSFTRLKTWTAEKLYAADLNSEFDNVGTYLNNNIAWVTNITASAADLNQLDNNRFVNASEFIAAIEDSASVTMNTGFVYTNHGKAIFDSLAADTLYATAQGPTKVQFGAGLVPDTTVGKGRYLGKPTGRFEAWLDTANVSVVVPAKIDTSAAFVIGRANIQTGAVDSTKIANNMVSYANQGLLSIDSLNIRAAAVSGGNLAGTLSGNKIWTGTQTHSGTTVLVAADSTYQAWPFSVVVDSAGDGHRTAIGTVSVSNKSIVIREGSYAGATISGSKNIIWVVGRITFTDSLLVTGNDNLVNLGPGASIGGTRISGDRNRLVFENGLSAGAVGIVAGADDNVVDGGGFGSLFAGGANEGVVINGKRTIIRNTSVTSNQHAIVVSATGDSSIVENCKVKTNGGATLGVYVAANYVIVRNCMIVAVGAIVGIRTDNDFGVLVGNESLKGMTIVAGADSNVVTGNNIRGAISNSGTGNILSGGIP